MLPRHFSTHEATDAMTYADEYGELLGDTECAFCGVEMAEADGYRLADAIRVALDLSDETVYCSASCATLDLAEILERDGGLNVPEGLVEPVTPVGHSEAPPASLPMVSQDAVERFLRALGIFAATARAETAAFHPGTARAYQAMWRTIQEAARFWLDMELPDLTAYPVSTIREGA
ncbi:MAG: hypothetical protein K6V97_04155 [Actinomycetia bacterium]|nr:hypothetical protein [Actinomycetes bacterium]